MILDYFQRGIENLTFDFFNATGINLTILDSTFNILLYNNHAENSQYCNYIQGSCVGKKNCALSDSKLLNSCKESKKVESHVCHAGLMDIAVPILNDDLIVGYIVLGQIKHQKNFQMNEGLLSYDNINIGELIKRYEVLPLYSDEKINSIIGLAMMLAKYLLLDDIIKPKQITSLDSVVDYINSNITKDLTVREISSNVFISTSTIYMLFKKYFNCTVNEYVNKRRIDNSLTLLKNTDYSIKKIAETVGFSNTTYYSKVFKKVMKTTPNKYRNEQN